jgi:hypothetical protein
MASQVKNQMIMEAYGDFVRFKHVVSMRQVNQIKHQGENQINASI